MGSQLCSPGVSLRSNYNSSQCAWAWVLQGGAADLHSSRPSGRSVLAVLGSPGLCLSQVSTGSSAVSLGTLAPGACNTVNGPRVP